MNRALLSYLKDSGEAIEAYFAAHPVLTMTPAELQEGTFVYFKRGGKLAVKKVFDLFKKALVDSGNLLFLLGQELFLYVK